MNQVHHNGFRILECLTSQWPELLLVHVLLSWIFPAMAGIS